MSFTLIQGGRETPVSVLTKHEVQDHLDAALSHAIDRLSRDPNDPNIIKQLFNARHLARHLARMP